jgi:hypothetical protein
MEIIRVVICSDKSNYYSGFKGSFDTLADSCLRKKSLPGLYQKDLIRQAAVDDRGLVLSLKTGLTDDDIAEIMDVALKNTGTFPAQEKIAEFSVFVEK